eukprot:gnl/TRDRNA2_/TRDRNA2_54425_c0_seq1.p1 gnl/TRDRNA2_/TRDRNA2_54425_c0~~gnl/TRDRNA2_/TRDRNA2_54425_c0_seq1.p1  ORF type:complete len:467 (-),score=81.27 gnl/TRDRNA2_/TRDRNA2_54425_c0_seq1:9-1409(-)
MWPLGVFLEFLSTLSGTLGKQLISLSELKKARNPRFAWTLFYVGLLVNTIAGPLLDLAAYTFAAQSLLAPFGGLDIVWNALLAPYVLKEKLTWPRIIACCLIFGGTVSAGAFGSHDDGKYTVEFLEETLEDVRILIYLAIFACWFLLNFLVLMRRPVGSVVRGVSLGATAGTIAGNMFCAKITVESVEMSIRHESGDIWTTWIPYAAIIGTLFFALSNVAFMTRGLLEFEALFMVTVYEGSMVVSNCVSAAVVLGETRDLELWRAACYWTSIAVVVAGLSTISLAEAKRGATRAQNHAEGSGLKEEAEVAAVDIEAVTAVLDEADRGGGSPRHLPLDMHGVEPQLFGKKGPVHAEVDDLSTNRTTLSQKDILANGTPRSSFSSPTRRNRLSTSAGERKENTHIRVELSEAFSPAGSELSTPGPLAAAGGCESPSSQDALVVRNASPRIVAAAQPQAAFNTAAPSTS